MATFSTSTIEKGNDSVQDFLCSSTQTLTVQGNPDQVMGIDRTAEDDYYMHLSDISDICVLPDGQVMVVDCCNNDVMLLNQQYEVVSQCKVSDEPLYMCPQSMCQITPSEVGVTVGSEIQFIKVNNSQLVKDRKLKFQHECYGIAHHQGDLFITSGTALYKYTLSGELVSKLHEDNSEKWTVCSCAVSPTGDKLYITDSSQNRLLTLARDGSVLASFTDPELIFLSVHVTSAGQVLVCGGRSHTILQVDRDGRSKLATLATRRDGLHDPLSVCYNRNTNSIIVGQESPNPIQVYKVQ